MNIQSAINWVVESNRLIDGASFISNNRTRGSVGLLHLSLEHNRGLVSCVENGIFGSAFALFRSQFEALVRGVWLQWCAQDEEVDNFLAGKEPPKINGLLEEINKVHGFESGALFDAKSALWKSMSDYTHGGAIQVAARNTANEIVVNYQAEHVHALLAYSVNLAFICGVQIAKVCDSTELANQLLTLHKDINAVQFSDYKQRVCQTLRPCQPDYSMCSKGASMDAKLCEEIEGLDEGTLIVIEGFSGSGKTTLAQSLSERLHIQYIDTDCYVRRQSNTEHYVDLLDIEHLKAVVDSFVERKKSLIYVGICAQDSLEKLGYSPGYRVYVKQLASSGLWHEGLHMEDYIKGNDPSGIYSYQPRKSDMQYHISKEPHRNANFLHEHVRD